MPEEKGLNYLAHVYLAGPQVTDRVGGLLGDFVKGPLPCGLPPDLASGVELHRFIDRYTDQHPAFMRSRQRISPSRRRFSGVMIDLIYDHFLARHWCCFCDEPLLLYTQAFYQSLEDYRDWLPANLLAILERMRQNNWLAAYADLAVIGRALDQIGIYRIQRSNPLVGSLSELEAHYAELEQDFWSFIPEVIQQVNGWRQARLAEGRGGDSC